MDEGALAGEPCEGWVWAAETKDEHINHDSLKLQHKKALKLAKVRPFEVYSIRHTFLTRLGESGCGAWTLARIAGHSKYQHLSALRPSFGGCSAECAFTLDSAENVIPAGLESCC